MALHLGNGRLKQIKSEDLSPLTLLQDLRYYNTATGASFYDAVGNLARIDDYKSGAPQSQYFSYDSLDRLTSAHASGGIRSGVRDDTFERIMLSCPAPTMYRIP